MPEVRSLGLPLPPARMPLLSRGRPLKRWRYVALYRPDLMVCIGDARVAGLPQRWWAVALPDGTLHERTTSRRGGVELSPGRARVETDGVSVDLALREGEGMEVASPSGTRLDLDAQAGAALRQRARARGRARVERGR